MHDVGPRLSPSHRSDALEVALREIEIGIELVLSGRAHVVELTGLEAAERAAGRGLAEAQVAGVEFRLLRSGSTRRAVSLRIGPRHDA